MNFVTSDTARDKHRILNDQKVEGEQREKFQKQELDAAKQRMKNHSETLEHHARDMHKAQSKIPHGKSP